MKHQIYRGDCLIRMKELKENSVDCTISSPPYFNAKKYCGEDNNIGNNKDYNDYLLKINEVIKELYRTTINGGIVCWNTSPVLDDGKRIGIPFDTHQLFIKAGFEFLEDIVWVKPDGAAKLRCGGWIQNKGRPTTWHANINTEYIMIYKKTGIREPKTFEPITMHYSIMPKDLLTCTWHINPETNKRYHDAPFPYELAKRCILLYSYPGDTILDPFCGSGTVMKVAKDLKRNSIGIELSEEYIEFIKEEIGFYQKKIFAQEEYIEK